MNSVLNIQIETLKKMLPIVLLSIFGLLVLFLGFQKSKNLLLPATLLVLAVVLVANFLNWNDAPSLYFKNMLFENKLTMSFSGIVLLSALLIVALTRGFIDDESAQPAEYYTIMLFSVVGAIMMIGFENLIIPYYLLSITKDESQIEFFLETKYVFWSIRPSVESDFLVRIYVLK